MTTKTTRILTGIISAVLAMVVGSSIIAGNIFIPVIAVAVAIGLTYWLRRHTSEVTKDERTTLLYEKAAGATIRLCVPLTAVAGIILFALRGRLSPEMAASGYVLAYIACGLLFVHFAFYSYYARKH